ncbi:MAG: hypothetical protein A2355_07860 [Spirochaetes bacterium RIFOXYB1_FULL_32_8]|nr:MAG: hypothetical protein A2Y30_01410 [Spirochaetes bacterium GWE1_32_154]OHD82610.1 MAG: hypothetical protein A2355_07860 [Spirochaetes bacterium RIFOXYB1_FULL_32_8]
MKKIALSFFYLFLFSVLAFSFTYNTTDEIKDDLKKYGNDPIIYTNIGIFYFLKATEQEKGSKQKEFLVAAKEYLENALDFDENYNKAKSYLGSVYGMLCGTTNNLSDILKYSNNSIGYHDDAVVNDFYNIDFRLNRIRTYIYFPTEHYKKINKILSDDLTFLLDYLEKDVSLRNSDYYYKITRADMYYHYGIVLKRIGEKEKAKLNFNKCFQLINKYYLNPPYINELKKEL